MKFIFARRFYWLLLIGVIPLSLGGLNPMLVWTVVAYDILLLGAAVLDAIGCGDGRPARPTISLQVERQTEQYFSLAAPNPVHLILSNSSSRPVTLQLRDEFPPAFEASDEEFRIELAPNQKMAVRYRLTPQDRGDFQFGRTIVRILGKWELVWRQIEYETRQVVRVYPNFRQAKHIELVAHRHRQMLVGLRRTRLHGPGREFESLRDFVVGDEIRQVSWTATARRGKLVTRQYQAERNQNLMIMLDTGRMMKAQIDRLSKLDHAINAALSLAYVALTGGDNVGLLVFDRQVKRYVPPRRGADQLNVLLETLYNTQGDLIEPHYARAFQYFSARNKKRSLVVILTDIINREASGELLAYTSLLTARHLPLIVTISDADLRALVRQVPTTMPDVYQQAVAEELLAERQEALTFIRSHGGLAIDVPIGDLAVEVVNQYLEVKEQGLL